MVVDEPVDEVALASALGLTVDRVRALLAELAAEYDEPGARFELRQVAGGWRIYSRAGVRARRRAVHARRPDRQAHPGRAGDAGDRRLPAAGEPGPGRCRPRRERRRGDAHAGHPRPGRGGRAPTRRPAPCSTGPPRSSCSGSGCPASTSCPALAPFLPEVDALDELGSGGAVSGTRRAGRGQAPERAGSPAGGAARPARAAAARGAPAAAVPARERHAPGRPRRRRRPARQPPQPRVRPATSTTRTASGCRRCSPRPASGPRRACEELIAAGRVQVDGQRVTELGVRVDPQAQRRARRRRCGSSSTTRWSTWRSTSRVGRASRR